MADKTNEDLDKLSGSALRDKYEETLRINRELSEKYSGLVAEKAIQAGGFTLVKPEDLAGVDSDEIEAEAQRIQEERKGLVESYLAANGQTVATSEESENKEPVAFGRSELKGVSGTPLGTPAPDPDSMSAREKLYFAEQQAMAKGK